VLSLTFFRRDYNTIILDHRIGTGFQANHLSDIGGGPVFTASDLVK